VGPRAVLDAVVKRKISSPRRESNSGNPIVQPVAQRYTVEKEIQKELKRMKNNATVLPSLSLSSSSSLLHGTESVI
jgi:hypothetical protein